MLWIQLNYHFSQLSFFRQLAAVREFPETYHRYHKFVLFLGAPKRKRRNARSGSHDTIAGPERNWKGWCFGVMINTNAFTGPRKTHPQVGQYVFPIFHCKGVGCVYISSENAFDKSALLVDRNKLKQYQNWMKTSLGWSSYWAPG